MVFICKSPEKCGNDFYCRACHNGFMYHLQKELTAAKSENEALRGRVAELEATIYAACKGDPDGICDEENWEYAYTMLFDVLRSTRKNAWLLRKQAEAVEVMADTLRFSLWGKAAEILEGYCDELRQQADELEND